MILLSVLAGGTVPAQSGLGSYGFTGGAAAGGRAYALVQPFAFAGPSAVIGLQPGVLAPVAESAAPEALAGVFFYPNPVAAVLHIRVDNPQWAGARLQVLDLHGKQAALLPVTLGMQELDMQALPAGTYALRLISREGQHSGSVLIVRQ